MKGTLFTDGGCRPTNPGFAAFGVVLSLPGGETQRVARYLGWRTNNYAEYCNPPSALSLMGDFSLQQLGDINIGDKVLGWDWHKSGGYRKFVRSEVIAKKMRRARVVAIELESGQEVFCTKNHMWAQPEWLNTRGNLIYRPAEVGRNIYRVVDDVQNLVPPSDPELAYWRGWLGGMYDGEGHRNTIAQSRRVNLAQHDRLGKALDKLGFECSFDDMGYSICGGRDEIMRFASWCRPSKLISDDYWINSIYGKQNGNSLMTANMTTDRVVKISNAGMSDVVSLQTESGNYNAWGLASKNCGLLVGTKMAIEAGVSNLVIITDSQLVQGHLMKGWKCNIDELRVLKRECELALATIPRWDIKWVRRSENKEADKICGEEIERIRALSPWRQKMETRLSSSRGTLV